MITLTYAKLRDVDFTSALGKLANFGGLKPRTAYHVGKLFTKCQSEMRTAQEKYLAIVKKYADKDDKGDPKIANEQFNFSVENKPKFDEECLELSKSEFSCKVDFVPFNEIEHAGLNAHDVMALLDILDGVPGEEPKKKSNIIELPTKR